MLRRILASLNSSGVGVRVRMYICVCMCARLWKENKKKSMMCLLWCPPSCCCTHLFLFVCARARSSCLSVGALYCGHFPSHHHRGFPQTQGGDFFFFHGIAVITRNIFWPLRDTVHLAFPFPLVCTADD